MLETITTLVLGLAVLTAGMMAGIYLAFSTFIMRALNQLGAIAAVDAMNAINEVILKSPFMLLFFGSTLLHIILVVLAFFETDLTGRLLLLIAGLTYLVGMFLCTAVFNVPLNNKLASAGGEDSAKTVLWPEYFKHWTRWNHLRAGCSLISAVLLLCY